MLIEEIDVHKELLAINKQHSSPVARLTAYGNLVKRMDAHKELAKTDAVRPSTSVAPTRKAVSAIATVQARVNELRQKEPGLSAVEALDQVLTSDPQLYARYRTEMEEARAGCGQFAHNLLGKSEVRQRFETLVKHAMDRGATLHAAYTDTCRTHPALYGQYCDAFRLHR